MSREYKSQVSQRVKHVLRPSDHVGTQLELLEILPCDRMADLLAAELVRRGLERQGDKLVRREADGVVVEIDPDSASVLVKLETEKTIKIEGDRQAWSGSPGAQQQEREKQVLRQQLTQDLQR